MNVTCIGLIARQARNLSQSINRAPQRINELVSLTAELRNAVNTTNAILPNYISNIVGILENFLKYAYMFISLIHFECIV